MGVELPIRFEIKIGLHRSGRNDVAELRTDADDAGLEGTQVRMATCIGANLLIEVPNRSDHQLLRERL